MVSYKAAIGVARPLGLQDAAALLVQTRAEEVSMDTTLEGLLVPALGVVEVT